MIRKRASFRVINTAHAHPGDDVSEIPLTWSRQHGRFWSPAAMLLVFGIAIAFLAASVLLVTFLQVS
jgi:hypothetical protein